MFEKAGGEGMSGNGEMEVSRAIGCRNVSERSVSQMGCELGYGVRGCGGEV